MQWCSGYWTISRPPGERTRVPLPPAPKRFMTYMAPFWVKILSLAAIWAAGWFSCIAICRSRTYRVASLRSWAGNIFTQYDMNNWGRKPTRSNYNDRELRTWTVDHKIISRGKSGEGRPWQGARWAPSPGLMCCLYFLMQLKFFTWRWFATEIPQSMGCTFHMGCMHHQGKKSISSQMIAKSLKTHDYK